MVKSVQRGIASKGSQNPAFIDVTINEVNPNKTFVNVQPITICFVDNDSEHLQIEKVVGRLTSSTNLRIVFQSKVLGRDVAWEVIEFY